MHDYRVPRPDDDSAIDIVELLLPLYKAHAVGETAEADAAIEARVTAGQRLLRAYNLFFAECEFNGFCGFFAHYGDSWRDVLAAMQHFEMPEDEQLFRRALSLFPGGAPADDWDERQAQVDAIDEARWDELDQCRRELPNTDAGIRRYILTHPDEFFRPRQPAG